ncbi:MAG: type II secretion system protein [Mucilaginibacter sp.]|uniref:type IV pilin protein n=1 Tax=Mucilaginibacter sp. TaxID=1882438 RepID=UPI0031B1E59D
MKRLKFRPDTRLKAVTLSEVLIVMIIAGILTFLALPYLLPVVTRAKAQEAKQQLEHLQTLEKSYYYEFSRYSNNFDDLGYVQEKLVTDDKNAHANYRIEITSATNTGFIARATSVVDFNGNGTFNTWEIDENNTVREITKD